MKIDDLLELYNSCFLNKTDMVLTQYFLEKCLDVEGLLLNDVILETQLSKSTIVRYCQSVGALNFTDFKQQFMEDYKSWRPSYHADSREDILDFAKDCAKIWKKSLVVIAGDWKTSYIWKMYVRDFYQKGYLLRIVSGTDDVSFEDSQCSYIYTSIQHSLKKYSDVNIDDMAVRKIYTGLIQKKDCTMIAPLQGDEASQTRYGLEDYDIWGNSIMLMKVLETVLNFLSSRDEGR